MFLRVVPGFYRVWLLFVPPVAGAVTVRLAPPGVPLPGGLYASSYQTVSVTL
jgi:hypothetical protein